MIQHALERKIFRKTSVHVCSQLPSLPSFCVLVCVCSRSAVRSVNVVLGAGCSRSCLEGVRCQVSGVRCVVCCVLRWLVPCVAFLARPSLLLLIFSFAPPLLVPF